MTTPKRGRGRPRKPFFKDGSPSRRNSVLTPLAKELALGLRESEGQLVRGFQIGPYVSRQLIWPILAASDDPESPEFLRGMKVWQNARAEQSRLGQEAARQRHRSLGRGKRLVIDLNKNRFEAVKAGRKSANAVAIYIRMNWQRLGLVGPPVSERTLHRWLAEYVGK